MYGKEKKRKKNTLNRFHQFSFLYVTKMNPSFNVHKLATLINIIISDSSIVIVIAIGITIVTIKTLYKMGQLCLIINKINDILDSDHGFKNIMFLLSIV